MKEKLKISSRQNPLFKEILLLEKSRERKMKQQFVIEGIKEIELAAKAGYGIEKIIFPEGISNSIIDEPHLSDIEKIEFTRELFNDLCYRKGIDNLIAIAKTSDVEETSINLPEKALAIVIESVEKPGNLGAILRTADAAGVDLVIVCDMATDIYNPNVIRSSLGCVFTNKIMVMEGDKAKDFLIREKFNIFTTYLQSANIHFEENYRDKTAIVFGTESTGVSDKWLTEEVKRIKIPMKGKIDSMNVSNSVAVILYEAIRQRTIK